MEHDDDLGQARQQSAEAKDEFLQADKLGTEALERGDYEAMLHAIDAEARAIEKHKAAIERVKKLHPKITTD